MRARPSTAITLSRSRDALPSIGTAYSLSHTLTQTHTHPYIPRGSRFLLLSPLLPTYVHTRWRQHYQATFFYMRVGASAPEDVPIWSCWITAFSGRRYNSSRRREDGMNESRVIPWPVRNSNCRSPGCAQTSAFCFTSRSRGRGIFWEGFWSAVLEV